MILFAMLSKVFTLNFWMQILEFENGVCKFLSFSLDANSWVWVWMQILSSLKWGTFEKDPYCLSAALSFCIHWTWLRILGKQSGYELYSNQSKHPPQSGEHSRHHLISLYIILSFLMFGKLYTSCKLLSL